MHAKNFLKNKVSYHCLVLAAISLLFFFCKSAQAATLQINTDPASLLVGKTTALTITLNSDGVAINNAEAVVKFPTDLLEVVSIDNKKSIFTSWIEQPYYSNDKGGISFNGGIPTPGYTGVAGEIFSVVLRAKDIGSANIFFSDAAIRANDGLGTNVLNGQDTSTINISIAQELKPSNSKLYFGEGTDTDGDGVPDQKENDIYKTNPQKADTDGDGYDDGSEIINGYDPTTKRQNINTSFSDKYKGRILLQTQEHGEAWFINPSDYKRYYMGRPQDAFDLMRKLGIGIADADLKKIPVGTENLGGIDSDSDGLSDMVEDSFGTNKNNSDSDGDGYNDKAEIISGYNPLGAGKLPIDKDFTESQVGKILLQVQKNGEAWYVNPVDNKRYFLGRPQDAFNLMRKLGLGISFRDLVKIGR
jgi:hypothetical protein